MDKKIAIDADDLIQAMSWSLDLMGGDGGWYLDTETGDVLLVSDAVDDLPEDIEDNPRYLWIEQISPDESYRIMEDFVDTLTDERAAQSLSRALEGRKPFRRFKDTLFDFPILREAWFAFEHEARLRLAEEWCEDNGIAAEWRPKPVSHRA